MAIPGFSCYDYHATLHLDAEGHLAGAADETDADVLLGRGPAVVVRGGRVTMTRRPGGFTGRSGVSTASFDGGTALGSVLRPQDRLSCRRGFTAEIGCAVSRNGALRLGLGALGDMPGLGVAVEHDPRVEEVELARTMRFMDRPGTRFVWLDPERPRELEATLHDLDRGIAGTEFVTIVVRTDDQAVSHELNRRTMMMPPRPGLAAMTFRTVSPRFSSAEEWLRYARALSPKRPSDLWLRIGLGGREYTVAEGTTAMADGWLVHVLRVHEPGEPGCLSQLGVAAADAGVTAAMLESSTAAIAAGVTLA